MESSSLEERLLRSEGKLARLRIVPAEKFGGQEVKGLKRVQTLYYCQCLWNLMAGGAQSIEFGRNQLQLLDEFIYDRGSSRQFHVTVL